MEVQALYWWSSLDPLKRRSKVGLNRAQMGRKVYVIHMITPWQWRVCFAESRFSSIGFTFSKKWSLCSERQSTVPGVKNDHFWRSFFIISSKVKWWKSKGHPGGKKKSLKSKVNFWFSWFFNFQSSVTSCKKITKIQESWKIIKMMILRLLFTLTVPGVKNGQNWWKSSILTENHQKTMIFTSEIF